MNLSKAYNPKTVEDRIYRFWQRSGFFNPDKLPKHHKKPYTIVIPPPNITGELHMGHALNAVIQDILIRQKRMQGFRALWLPGTDHAGIATQNVVEKKLKKEGLTRFDLGREKFIKEVWAWKEKYGDIILNQFKKLGSSCDWSRTRFTMDKDYSRAIKEAFLHYYKKGLIYRGERTINWCPRCSTSLSDLEIEYQEESAKLYYIKYGPITIATVRPETKLGDTAVAVNPKDPRYKKYIGKTIVIKTVLGPAKMKVIGDESVDMDFGTGAMKVTPAHDPHDFELGEKHGLERKQVIGPDAKMTKLAGKYSGMTVREARRQIVKDMKKIGILEKTKPYIHNIARCYRCNTVLEPILSKQWFLKMEDLAKSAIGPVKKGQIKFIPKNFEKPYFDWLENIRDWCISRQIWWGHQLPVWYCKESEGKIKNTISKMGFAGTVVAQVFDNKTRTYRLRNHHLKVGDRVLFENSATGEIFGTATITEVKKTNVGKIDLKDKKHWKTYKKLEELIAAFKRHHPEKEVTASTPAWIYTYKFESACPPVVGNKYAFKKCPYCKIGRMKQKTDVLDTWFSSALWPLAALGWPASAPAFVKAAADRKAMASKPKKSKKSDLETFYPTDVLSTARDIINLWVARMVFSGQEFLKKIPFKTVYIHATVLTREGKRMSKSLGTGVDPIKLIEEYGADAVRFGIAYQITGSQDMKFVVDNIAMGKKFCNKIWNATRFTLSQIPNSLDRAKRETPRRVAFQIPNKFQIPKSKLTTADKRILRTLDKTIKSVNKDLDNFQFGKAAHALYDFFWHDFCDKYIEKSKSQIVNSKSRRERERTSKILLHVLLTSLKLLHPFIPFVTEEIYQKLLIHLPKFSKGKLWEVKNKKRCLMIEEWPSVS